MSNSAAAALAALKQKVTIEQAKSSVEDKGNQYKDELDDLFYVPEKDKAGNAHAIIRFLPPTEGEDSAFIKLFNHPIYRKADKRWFIHNCPASIGEKCPVCEAGTALWSSGIDSNKEPAKEAFKKTSYFANIIVLSDPKNPEKEYENSGKVYLFRFTKQIYDIISRAINPEFDDEDGFNPFDPWNGANFRFRVTKKNDFPTYEASKFDNKRTPLFNGSDDAIFEVYKKQHNLSQLILNPNRFLGYEELEKKYLDFTSASIAKSKPKTDNKNDLSEDDSVFDVDMSRNKAAAAASSSLNDEDDDDLYSTLLDD